MMGGLVGGWRETDAGWREIKAEAKAAKRFAPEAPGGGWYCGR